MLNKNSIKLIHFLVPWKLFPLERHAHFDATFHSTVMGYIKFDCGSSDQDSHLIFILVQVDLLSVAAGLSLYRKTKSVTPNLWNNDCETYCFNWTLIFHPKDGQHSVYFWNVVVFDQFAKVNLAIHRRHWTLFDGVMCLKNVFRTHIFKIMLPNIYKIDVKFFKFVKKTLYLQNKPTVFFTT